MRLMNRWLLVGVLGLVGVGCAAGGGGSAVIADAAVGVLPDGGVQDGLPGNTLPTGAAGTDGGMLSPTVDAGDTVDATLPLDGSLQESDAGGGGACPTTTPSMTATPGTCDWQTYCGHGYWFCTNNLDWDDARTACVAAGGDLLSINDQAEQDFVVTHATGGNQWQVGLNKINLSGMNSPDVWEWVDGRLAMGAFENWRNGEPDNGDCGAIDSGNWIDWACTNPEDWICEIP